MGSVRTLAAVAVTATCAATGMALAQGAASAYVAVPYPGGVEVTLNHDETVWVRDNHVGHMVARIPNPSAPSFGGALENAAAVASDYPNGYVIFSAEGPIESMSGYMLAIKG